MMTIEFAAVSIGIFLIVWGAWMWKKLRVVEGRLALMQNDLKELHVMESRLFHMMLNAPTSFKKAPDTESTSVPAAPVTKPVGSAGHVADRHRRAALDEHIAELYATPAAVTQTTKKGGSEIAAPSK